MIFQDNVIKEYLKNVYFITGTHVVEKQRFHANWQNVIIYWSMILTNSLKSIRNYRTLFFSRR